jgi:aminoglycoside 6'-N-acetyltransferase
MSALPKRPTAYGFRPMRPDDVALVRIWQMAPHVRDWWDDEEITPTDGRESALDQYIVTFGGRAFAYLQCYLQSACPGNGLGTHPLGTRGIDQFIGEPDMIGRGHGSAFVRAFADGLLTAGVPRVITDPALANARAIAAYAKAGFCRDREVDTPDGRALLMMRDASNIG